METQQVMRPKLEIAGKYRSILMFFISWFAIGTIIDEWAHFHVIKDIETFFTPYHFVLYTGGLGTSLFLSGIFARNYLFGYSIRDSIPRGYELSYVGLILFIVSGVGDGIWHTLYGIEFGIEAAYSPTHNLGFVAGVLIWGGPIRAALLEAEKYTSRGDQGVIALTVIFLYGLLGAAFAPYQIFFMVWMVDFAPNDYRFQIQNQVLDTDYLFQAVGMAGFIIFSVMITLTLAVLLKRFSLQRGVLSSIFAGIMVMQSMVNYNFYLIPAAIIGGIMIEVLAHIVKPSVGKFFSWEIYTVLVAFLVSLSYIISVILFVGTWWSIHMFLGAPFIAALVAGLVMNAMIQFSKE